MLQNCFWNLISSETNWLKILDHGYCDEWRQALNFWPFILKSWIISMKMSIVSSLMHVIIPLSSDQSKLKSFSNSNTISSISNVDVNRLVTLFQRSCVRGARVSWPRCTWRMAGDSCLVLSFSLYSVSAFLAAGGLFWSSSGLVRLSSLLETERVSVIR